MTAAGDDLPDRAGRRRRIGGHQRVLAALVAAGAAIVLTATGVAAGGLEVGVAIAFALLAAWCAVTPDSDLGLLLLVALAAHWMIAVDGSARTGVWLPVAATGLLVVHAAMAAATVAPPTAAWTSTMARTWGRRVAVVAVATWATTGLTVVLTDTASERSGSAPVLVAALAATAALAWTVRTRSLRRR